MDRYAEGEPTPRQPKGRAGEDGSRGSSANRGSARDKSMSDDAARDGSPGQNADRDGSLGSTDDGRSANGRCARCGMKVDADERGPCDRCGLKVRAKELIAPDTPEIPERWSRVYEAICAAPNPRMTERWLREGATPRILTDVATSVAPVTHGVLDSYQEHDAADYVRYMLVRGGVLERRDEGLERVRRWVFRHLRTVRDARNRQTVKEFWSNHVGPNVAAADEAATRQLGTVRAKRKVRGAVDFLVWLEHRGLGLHELRQMHVNEWLRRGSQANDVASFVMWAGTQGYCVRVRVPTAEDLLRLDDDVERYWNMVDRFLDDEGLDVADRVAACLVLLYGRRTEEIASLTSREVIVDGSEVRMTFDGVTVALVPSLAGLMVRLMRGEGAHGGTTTPDDRRSLFGGPWYREHITPFRLAERLSEHGLGGVADLMTRKNTDGSPE
ncbi:hypothetical protein [Phytoactinopolyspora halotolerans]|uniref:Uncharacterized protein n=1 Tax=Phytoactinopolyspora halotolerans TaxID=1981512 RepID=A0A6L9SIN3_9ACTN|nr:hypothetical protein [Phytoactinopolyspora halotolerans]NEE03930.1 hypothetical protein [Phytoactinopolyspora halotolerans]